MTDRLELAPPTADDYDVLKEAILEMATASDVTKRFAKNGFGLFFVVERLYSDCETDAWPLLMVRFSGILKTQSGAEKMVLRYRELMLHADTENNSVNHDYILRRENRELTEFGHSMRAAPLIAEPFMAPPETPREQYYAEMGKKILESQTGNQLELTAGDCGVLYDRILDLII